ATGARLCRWRLGAACARWRRGAVCSARDGVGAAVPARAEGAVPAGAAGGAAEGRRLEREADRARAADVYPGLRRDASARGRGHGPSTTLPEERHGLLCPGNRDAGLRLSPGTHAAVLDPRAFE